MPKKVIKHLQPHQFKPGQSGNPEGARAHNPITKALKNLTVATYREVIELVLTGNLDALKDMVHDPKSSSLQVGIAKAFAKAIENGDYGVIERIAERIVGKIPDELNVNSNNNSNVNMNAAVAVVTDEELKARMARIRGDV